MINPTKNLVYSFKNCYSILQKKLIDHFKTGVYEFLKYSIFALFFHEKSAWVS